MALIDQLRKIVSGARRSVIRPSPTAPAEGETCLNCGADLRPSATFARYRVCPTCQYHYNLPARQRIEVLADADSFRGFNRFLASQDTVQSAGRSRYKHQLQEARRRTGLLEGVVTGVCRIFGREIVLMVVDFGFLGGSVGSVVGEKITRAFELAAKRKLPVVSVVASSGPRLQEGPLALMQSAKILAAARRLHVARLPHICIMTNPTTGGIYTGFANIADLIIAEPNALLGFASRGAIAQALQYPLPEYADTAEAYLARGAIDQVVGRTHQRELLSVLIDLLSWRYRLTLAGRWRRQIYEAPPRPPWQTVQFARHQQRPSAKDYIARLTSSFVEIRGDRIMGDDPAIVCGLADLAGESVMIIAEQRLRFIDPADQAAGRIKASGFHKARRAMLLAAKFRLPIISLIDADGAYLGLEGEQSNIGYAAAQCVSTMSDLPTPIVSAVIGTATSEAALVLGIADRMLMMENALFSLTAPGAYHDEEGPEASVSPVQFTAYECRQIGIVDAIVPEPSGGAHVDHDDAARLLKQALQRELAYIQVVPIRSLLASRYRKFRRIGRYSNLRSAISQPVRRARGRLVEEAREAASRFLPFLRRRPLDDSEDVSIP